MTAASKWIAVESHKEPVTRVARRALKERLRWLWSRLPLAALDAEKDVEHVHQLRVASRRANAAMETFGAYLPPKRAEWFDRQIKRIRRAAGEARDLDVLAARLHAEFNGDRDAAAESVLRRIAAARDSSQPEIVDVYHRLKSRRFHRRIGKLVRRIRIRERSECDAPGETACECDPQEPQTAACDGECQCREPSISEAARQQIKQLVDEWFAAADEDLSDTHRLHLFRIAGKRLRYAMEIFASALGSNCRKVLYPQVVEILEHLGQINDHVSSEARLQGWLNDSQDSAERQLLTHLLSRDSQAVAENLHSFFQLWTSDRRESLRKQFVEELADG